ncbi:hypothetical protein DENSPDRAFT_85572 [Dentipellis sp. KUC8613]|nr:hypothetical protein DENSPDRAFT_85572 [Dentipellis sp. KUC8613]
MQGRGPDAHAHAYGGVCARDAAGLWRAGEDQTASPGRMLATLRAEGRSHMRVDTRSGVRRWEYVPAVRTGGYFGWESRRSHGGCGLDGVVDERIFRWCAVRGVVAGRRGAATRMDLARRARSANFRLSVVFAIRQLAESYSYGLEPLRFR